MDGGIRPVPLRYPRKEGTDMELGVRLKEYRNNHGMTQEEKEIRRRAFIKQRLRMARLI